ncbi:MAG: hypothetical protein JJU13_08325 [Balneolaceae bacterium]|nr:hypothetical protein [Balneolaceae bacterium]
MTHSTISYSIVGVWSKPIQKIPLLEKKFCLELFDDPYQTEHGLADDGFVIALNDNKKPMPLVKINPLRIQFVHRTIEELIAIIEKVVEELKRLTSSKFDFNLKAIGVNTEHEWTGLEINAEDYLSQQYLQSKISTNSDYLVKAKSLSFQIFSEDNGLYGIKLEPRANNKKGLFCSINDHRDVNITDFPDKKMITSLFDDSLKKLESNVFENII